LEAINDMLHGKLPSAMEVLTHKAQSVSHSLFTFEPWSLLSAWHTEDTEWMWVSVGKADLCETQLVVG
jgi:hypothetical protein